MHVCLCFLPGTWFDVLLLEILDGSNNGNRGENVRLTTVGMSALVQGVSKGCFIDSVIAQ